jgi:hypothetical protein
MRTTHRKSFAVIVLTALGVLPVPSTAQLPESGNRAALTRLNPIDLERATIVQAVKQVHDEIRSGRLGH